MKKYLNPFNATIPVMPVNSLDLWIKKYITRPIDVDCITTVMLKILDGKCKMIPEEKSVMTALYLHSRHLSGDLLKDDIHSFISHALNNLSEELKNEIYEKRVLAETMISRPVMKEFKAMIRKNGLFKIQGINSFSIA